MAAGPLQADALLNQLLAEAGSQSVRPFQREIVVEAPGKPAVVRRDRYYPDADQPWALVSVDGHAPTEDDIKDWRKDVDGQSVPGVQRLPVLLAGPAARSDENGAIIYRWDQLAKNALGLKGPDVSAHLSAEGRVEYVGGKPTITSVRIFTPKPFSVMLVARIREIRMEMRYARADDGSLRLVSQKGTTDASIPFRPAGVTKTRAHFTELKERGPA